MTPLVLVMNGIIRFIRELVDMLYIISLQSHCCQTCTGEIVWLKVGA